MSGGSRDLRQRGKQQQHQQPQEQHADGRQPPIRGRPPPKRSAHRPRSPPWLLLLLAACAIILGATRFLLPEDSLLLPPSLGRLLGRAPLPPELVPLPGAPRLTAALPELTDPAHKGELMWGSYRSGLYFGMSTRSLTPLVTGLMWFDPDLPTPIRHAAEQGDNAPQRHGWQRHDGRSYGRQRIVDGAYDMTVHMVKRFTNATRNSGGDWAVRLSVGAERPPADEAEAQRRAQEAAQFEHLLPADPNLRQQKKRLALVWYIGDARWGAGGSELSVGVPPLPAGARGAAGKRRRLGDKGVLLAQGAAHPDVGGGGWSVRVVPGESGAPGLAAPTRHAAAANVRVLALRPREEMFTGGGGGGGKKKSKVASEPGEGPGAEALVHAADLVRQDLLQGVRERGLSRGFNMELSDAREPKSTLLFAQVTVELPAVVDIVFTPHRMQRGGGGGGGGSASKKKEEDQEQEETLEQRAARLSGPSLTALIAERESQFDARFERAFRVPDEDVPPGPAAAAAADDSDNDDDDDDDDNTSPGVSAADVKEAAKAALSNLLGTMGYYAGRPLVLVRGKLSSLSAAPYTAGGPLPGAAPNTVVGRGFLSALFTAVPSRSTFPRGFLWDEGFHQLLVRTWDGALCRDALAHWLDLVTASGWVPREQILGAEARARVPQEFVVQRPGHGNPPSLMLPLLEMAEDVRRRAAAVAAVSGGGSVSAQQQEDLTEVARGAEFLARAWPRLEAWYGWFNRTQAGSAPGAYRWHGRVPVPAPLTRGGRSAASSSSPAPSAAAQAAQWAAAARGAQDEASREEAEEAALSLSDGGGGSIGGNSLPLLPARLSRSRAELNPKTLTSGLDDYPRASHPSPDERHLDLRCWMALASRAMAEVARAAREGLLLAEEGGKGRQRRQQPWPEPPSESAAERYESAARALSDLTSLKRLHLDEASGEFRDYGLHTDDVRLARGRVAVAAAERGAAAAVAEREVREEHGAPPQPSLVPAYGYVSLFPLLTGLLPAGSPDLARQLELLRRGGGAGGAGGEDEAAGLWTPHGLRSLAPSSPLYRARNTADDPPYWRGQVWINVNYLALRALRRYALEDGDATVAAAAGEAARLLRQALLRTVAGGYARTGFFWEQYDDRTGEGMGSRPFTGWTALVTLIAADD